ncbi:hypothetical protein GW17_00003857 [Ensete ventricosum]|nr:hypothetical protein GW17_00003857 [Ensete ventricosum]
MEKAAPRSPAPATTFVRADAATFKELVQRLTAGPQIDDAHKHHPAPSSSSSSSSSHKMKLPGLKRQHEQRRGVPRRRFTALRPRPLSLPASPAATSPAMSPAVASPSTSFARLHICEEGGDRVQVDLNEAEAQAIKERKFYLHPSPRPRNAEAPELLPLFPLSPSSQPSDRP